MMSKTKQAFSMIEVLLYMAMIAVFSLVVTSYWSSLNELRIRGQAMTTVTTESAYVMEQLTQIIRNADSVNGMTTTSLNLKMLDVNKDPTTVSFSGGQLTVQEGSSAAVNLISNRVVLSGINFTNLTTSGKPASIRIQLQLSNNNTSGRNEANYSTTLYDTASLRK